MLVFFDCLVKIDATTISSFFPIHVKEELEAIFEQPLICMHGNLITLNTNQPVVVFLYFTGEDLSCAERMEKLIATT